MVGAILANTDGLKKTKISFHLIGRKQIQLDFVTSVALDCEF